MTLKGGTARETPGAFWIDLFGFVCFFIPLSFFWTGCTFTTYGDVWGEWQAGLSQAGAAALFWRGYCEMGTCGRGIPALWLLPMRAAWVPAPWRGSWAWPVSPWLQADAIRLSDRDHFEDSGCKSCWECLVWRRKEGGEKWWFRSVADLSAWQHESRVLINFGSTQFMCRWILKCTKDIF